MATKYYAVHIGRKTGVFKTWNECSEQVTGYKGAVFKSFSTHELASIFCNQGSVTNIIKNEQDVYTDGSCVLGVGGYGYLWMNIEKYGRVPIQKCTNQKAELYAVKMCLLDSELPKNFTIHTDSKYTIGCLTEWYHNWLTNGWITSNKTPVENQDIIKDCLNAMNNRTIKFKHVYGHSNDPYNERVDILANQGRLINI